MFRLASLVCSGCNLHGRQNSFYDNDKKLPCLSECGHSICLKCKNQFTNCPVCEKPIVLRNNYAARFLFEDYFNDPITVFKKWWNPERNEKETCTGCSDSCKTLRICVTCDAKKLNYVIITAEPDEEKSWTKSEEKQERRKQLEKFESLSLFYSERDPDENYDEMNLKLVLGCDYYLYANLGRCSSCLLDHHKGHLINTLDELAPLMDSFKQNASQIATDFLWTELRKMNGTCKIKTMRMHRTCEKISHFANFYFRSEITVKRPPDIHLRAASKVSKFFESLPFTNDDNITREDVDKLILSLESQMKHLDCSEGCKCTSIWEEMHKMSLGNKIKRLFVDIIQGMESDELSNCPFPFQSIEEIQKNAIQLYKTKLYLIYSAFCWNKKEHRICGLYNKNDKKPYKCSECGITVCSKCTGNQALCQSSTCGLKLLTGQDVDITLTLNQELLDLSQYYKENCFDILHEWWNSDASWISYCLNCRSYSDQLEICVFCESHQKNCAVKTCENLRDIIENNHENSLFFNYEGLKQFSMRWQCSDCKNRRVEEWVHKNEKKHEDSNTNWKRGCDHPGDHLCCWKVPDKCELVSIPLKFIGNYEIAMKVSTSELIFSILKAGIDEKIKCHLRRIEFQKAYSLLKTQINCYFRNVMSGRVTGRLEEKAREIVESIETLRTKWSNYKPEGEECSCNTIWKSADKISKRKFLECSIINAKGVSDKCQLDLSQDILK